LPVGIIAEAAGCHRNTVARIARLRRVAAPPEPEATAAAAGALPVPEHFAELHAALMSPGLRKTEAAPLLVRAAAALGAEALVRQDLAVERTGQVLARLAERVAALPDQGPGAGADACQGPATFEETNAFLDELARHFADFGVTGDAAAAGEPLRQG